MFLTYQTVNNRNNFMKNLKVVLCDAYIPELTVFFIKSSAMFKIALYNIEKPEVSQ